MMRHGIEARRAETASWRVRFTRARPRRGTPDRGKTISVTGLGWRLQKPPPMRYFRTLRIATKAKKVSVVVAKNFVFQFLR